MGKKILIVDDDHALHELLNEVLSEAHFDLLHAHTGRDGIEKAKTETPDLIISDVNMPGLNGFALSTLLKQHSSTQNIPVIFLTGFMGEKEAQELNNELDGRYLLTKPFNHDILLNLVQKAVIKL